MMQYKAKLKVKEKFHLFTISYIDTFIREFVGIETILTTFQCILPRIFYIKTSSLEDINGGLFPVFSL